MTSLQNELRKRLAYKNLTVKSGLLIKEDSETFDVVCYLKHSSNTTLIKLKEPKSYNCEQCKKEEPQTLATAKEEVCPELDVISVAGSGRVIVSCKKGHRGAYYFDKLPDCCLRCNPPVKALAEAKDAALAKEMDAALAEAMAKSKVEYYAAKEKAEDEEKARGIAEHNAKEAVRKDAESKKAAMEEFKLKNVETGTPEESGEDKKAKRLAARAAKAKATRAKNKAAKEKAAIEKKKESDLPPPLEIEDSN